MEKSLGKWKASGKFSRVQKIGEVIYMGMVEQSHSVRGGEGGGGPRTVDGEEEVDDIQLHYYYYIDRPLQNVRYTRDVLCEGILGRKKASLGTRKG